MSELIYIIKITAFFISFLGYVLLLSKNLKKTDICYLPILAISLISLVLLFCAYFQVLYIAAILMYVSGFVLFLYCIIKLGIKSIDIRYIVLLFAVIILGFILKEASYCNADSYSHYGLILRYMQMHNCLPDEGAYVIQYRDYPAAMTCWQYFFTLYVGQTEGIACLAQGIVFVCCIFSLLRDSKCYNVAAYIFAVWFGYSLSGFLIGLDDLMLDTIVPLVGACGISLLIGEKDMRKDSLFTAFVILSFCALTKNSGLCFYIVAVLLIFIYSDKTHMRNNKKDYIYILLPGVSYILWYIHVKLAFLNGTTSNHAMSIENYIRVYKNREGIDLAALVKRFLRFTLEPDSPSVRMIVLLLIFCIIVRITGFKAIKYKKYCVAIFSGYFLWMFFLIGMYIFSMEDSAPESLLSFDRYRASAEIYMLTLIAYMIAGLISRIDYKKIFESRKGIRLTILPEKKTKPKKNVGFEKKRVSSVLIYVICFILCLPVTNGYNRDTYHIDLEYKNRLTDMVSSGMELEESYVVYIKDMYDYDTEYLVQTNQRNVREVYVMMYALMSEKIFLTSKLDDIDSEKYRYLVFLEDDTYSFSYKKEHNLHADEKFIDMKATAFAEE